MNRKMTYKKKFLIYFSLLFALFAITILIMQNVREKQYKEDNVISKLKVYTTLIDNYIDHNKTNYDSLTQYMPKELRVTIINNDGVVFYDNAVDHVDMMENHIARPEVRGSIKSDKTTSSVRRSSTTGVTYMYVATEFKNHIIRLALPFDDSLKLQLRSDNFFFLVIVMLLFAGLFAVSIFSSKFGATISALRDFAINPSNDVTFPSGELGEIGETIKHNYNIIKLNQLQKQEITSNISHELRTPISTISGYLETIIQHKDMDAETSQKFIKKAFLQSQRLSDLIKDVSLLSKIESDDASLSKEPMYLRPVINDVIEHFETKILETEATVNVNVPTDIILNGNQTLIHAIFRNLVENSLKYGGKGVHININLLESTFEMLKISVWDSGKGVESQHLSKIFERFYRPSDGRTRVDGGSGLGLSIVKNAILCHSGTVVARQHEGEGLEVIFTLKTLRS